MRDWPQDLVQVASKNRAANHGLRVNACEDSE